MKSQYLTRGRLVVFL